MSASHEAHVVAQFGPRARAYVESADHARGADLERLAQIAAAAPGCRVLDLGCGGGHVSFAVAPHAAEVVAYDLAHEMLDAVAAVARTRGLSAIRCRQGSATALPFDDRSFDLVMTRFSAHHWHDLAGALAGMRRVLAPGGRAIVVDTIAPEPALHDTFLQAIELLRDPSHVRDHTVTQWEVALRRAGLVPSVPVRGRLRLAFAAWVARIGTPPALVAAIRALQREMPTEVAAHYAVEPDGSFTIDTMLVEAEVSPARAAA